MARFTNPGDGGGSGVPGPQGPAGTDGADALWNFISEYDNGADYNIGDVVTYNGGTYYRVGEPNPGYPPGTSYWTTVAEPGQDGTQGPQGNQGPQGDPGVSGTTGLETWTRYSPNFAATGLAFTGSNSTYPTYDSNKHCSSKIELLC